MGYDCKPMQELLPNEVSSEYIFTASSSNFVNPYYVTLNIKAASHQAFTAAPRREMVKKGQKR